MATERLLMRHIREILRLKWTLRRSHRETARSLGILRALRIEVSEIMSTPGIDASHGLDQPAHSISHGKNMALISSDV